ncbi:MAG TPA: ABC transporter ATP-binding protein [Vicinamibacterales bacterium]|nr:ABC transporter ATP-binding protein [Vicinamibacterales bacterium]
MNTALKVDNLVKTYDHRALDRMSFRVPRGSICGFLGPNGAGKTTTLRIVMGFAFAEAGSVDVLGGGAMSPQLLQRIGFVPEVKELYPFARAGEMIRLTRGFYPRWDYQLEAELLRDFDIPLRSWCTKLSKGTKTRLALLLAVCRNADLLILDEPTEGLDPVASDRLMRLLVQQVADRQVTVLFSTHQLSEVEQIADYMVMVNHGRAVLEGSLDEIRQRHQRVRIVIDNDRVEVPAAFSGWRRDGRFLTGLSHEAPAVLAERFAAAGVTVLDAEPATLKEVFLAQAEK